MELALKNKLNCQIQLIVLCKLKIWNFILFHKGRKDTVTIMIFSLKSLGNLFGFIFE